MPLQLAGQDLPAVLQLCLGHELTMPIWLNWNKTAERIQPLRSFTSESSSLPLQGEMWVLEVAGSSARLWTLPSPFPLPVEDLSPVLPPAGPAGVKLHSSAPTEHSSGDLWLVLAFFYLNNSPALALKLLSSAPDVTFASRYQFFCAHSTQKLYTGTAGQS